VSPESQKSKGGAGKTRQTPAPPQSEIFQISKIELLHNLARIYHELAQISPKSTRS